MKIITLVLAACAFAMIPALASADANTVTTAQRLCAKAWAGGDRIGTVRHCIDVYNEANDALSEPHYANEQAAYLLIEAYALLRIGVGYHFLRQQGLAVENLCQGRNISNHAFTFGGGGFLKYVTERDILQAFVHLDSDLTHAEKIIGHEC